MMKNGRLSDVSALGDVGLLVVEILCRLGCPEHAIQCKLVCKLWCSLVNVNPNNNSYFLRRWRQVNYKKAMELPMILLTQYQHCENDRIHVKEPRRVMDDGNYKGGLTFNLNFLPCGGPIPIWSTYKDLLLCCPCQLKHDSCYYICNPFTKQWTALAPPPISTNFEFRSRVALIVYDDGENDNDFNFRVVVCIGMKDKIVRICDNGGPWREMEYNDGMILYFARSRNEVFYNGMLVSLVDKYEGVRGLTTSLCGLKFDVNANCTRVPLPLPLDEPIYDLGTLRVFQGRLRLANVDYPRRRRLMVWQLDSSRHEWDKVQELDLNQVDHPALGKLQEMFTVRVLALHPLDENVLYVLYHIPHLYNIKRASYIFLCNLKETRLELIREIGELEHPRLFSLELPCWPTPVPLLNPNATILSFKT